MSSSLRFVIVSLILDNKQILEKYPKLLQNIREWKLECLRLSKDFCKVDLNHNRIVKSVIDIRFPLLKKVYIEEKAETIEGINRIHMPHLKELYISKLPVIQSTTN